MEVLTENIILENKNLEKICRGVYRLPVIMVNVYFLGEPERDTPWYLVDAGLGNCSDKIKEAAGDLFGYKSKPEAIILTHGHFDHVGAIKELIAFWDVPVYAHKKELPYLNGKSSYPPPDPSVGGGAMSFLSWMYPNRPIDIRPHLKFIENDQIPDLDEWKVIETPGHSPGHISLFRESDRTLIAGDAIVTVKQESALAVLTQTQELHGPPAYFTYDWYQARHSVHKLSVLDPEVAACGHGLPMQGPILSKKLKKLADNFHIDAVPAKGRYIHDPAKANEQGVVYLPPEVNDKSITISAAVIFGIAATVITFLLLKNKKD